MQSIGIPSVLIVDDEPIMRGLLREHVEGGGFRPIDAVGPEQGVAALENDPSISLVLTDVRMPDPNVGLEFIRAIRRRWPALSVVAVTGYPADLDLLGSSAERPALVVSKPFRAREIDDVLRLALEGSTARSQARALPTARGQASEHELDFTNRLGGLSQVATALTDLNCTILTCNQQAALLLGFEHAGELVGRNAFDFFAPEDVERAVSNAQATLRSGAVRSIEYTVVKRDGTRFRVELSASLICDPDGDPQAFTAVIRDITGQKAANEPIRQRPAPARARQDRATTDPRLGLSDRESEVYRLLLSGLSNKEIAGRLVISVKTVEFHVSRILQKLRAKSRLEAVLMAYPSHLRDQKD